jgi:hypothetical protein
MAWEKVPSVRLGKQAQKMKWRKPVLDWTAAN